jgi:hypothetical protein
MLKEAFTDVKQAVTISKPDIYVNIHWLVPNRRRSNRRYSSDNQHDQINENNPSCTYSRNPIESSFELRLYSTAQGLERFTCLWSFLHITLMLSSMRTSRTMSLSAHPQHLVKSTPLPYRCRGNSD